jgi:ubiquinone/menaquinone biosynthesis C-methylase UbiE
MDPNLTEEYNNWHRSVHSEESGFQIDLKQWHYDALALGGNLEGKKVLEVGCGVGDFAFAMESKGARVTAVDFSDAAIEIACQKRSERRSTVEFRNADAGELPFGDGSFDIVFTCECLEHLPNPATAVKEMARVLLPGGSLVLTTENYSNLLLLVWLKCIVTGKAFNSGDKPQPIERFFVFPMVYQMFANAGLRMQATLASHHIFLLLPRVNPHRFVIEQFKNPFLAKIFKFLGRHWTYSATKPA